MKDQILSRSAESLGRRFRSAAGLPNSRVGRWGRPAGAVLRSESHDQHVWTSLSVAFGIQQPRQLRDQRNLIRIRSPGEVWFELTQKSVLERSPVSVSMVTVWLLLKDFLLCFRQVSLRVSSPQTQRLPRLQREGLRSGADARLEQNCLPTLTPTARAEGSVAGCWSTGSVWPGWDTLGLNKPAFCIEREAKLHKQAAGSLMLL